MHTFELQSRSSLTHCAFDVVAVFGYGGVDAQRRFGRAHQALHIKQRDVHACSYSVCLMWMRSVRAKSCSHGSDGCASSYCKAYRRV